MVTCRNSLDVAIVAHSSRYPSLPKKHEKKLAILLNGKLNFEGYVIFLQKSRSKNKCSDQVKELYYIRLIKKSINT